MVSHIQKVINDVKKFCRKKCKKYDLCNEEISTCPLKDYKSGENPWYKPVESSPEIRAKRSENMAKARARRAQLLVDNKPVDFEE